MKRLLFTLVMCLIMVSGFGSHFNSELNVRTWNNAPFILVLNHQSFGQNNSHAVNQVRPGRAHVKLVQRTFGGYGSCGGGTRVLYNGFVDVPSSSRVSMVFRPGCGLQIVDVAPLYAGPMCGHGHSFGTCGFGCEAPVGNCSAGCAVGACSCGNQGGGQGGGGYYDPGYDDFGAGNGHGHGHGNGGFGQGNGQGNGQGGFGQGNGGFSQGAGFNQGMRPQAFNNLKYQVRNASFDDDKLRIAMQAIKANGIRANQVRELMEMMGFESTRLKLAKRAYRHTADKQSYYVVNDAFAFSSSRRQLQNYIYSLG